MRINYFWKICSKRNKKDCKQQRLIEPVSKLNSSIGISRRTFDGKKLAKMQTCFDIVSNMKLYK